jgi:hypothetical protein
MPDGRADGASGWKPDLSAAFVHEVDDALPSGGLFLGDQLGNSAWAIDVHAGCGRMIDRDAAGEDQADLAVDPAAIKFRDVLAHDTARRRVAVHRRHRDAILDRQPADAERFEHVIGHLAAGRRVC